MKKATFLPHFQLSRLLYCTYSAADRSERRFFRRASVDTPTLQFRPQTAESQLPEGPKIKKIAWDQPDILAYRQSTVSNPHLAPINDLVVSHTYKIHVVGPPGGPISVVS